MTGAPARRRVVLTGASGGIGGAVARRYLAEGAAVANIDLRPASVPGLATHPADVSDPAQVEAAFAGIDRAFGGEPPDLFVACAAVSRAAHVLDVAPADLDRMLAVNVRGLFLTAQAAARRMARARAGVLVFVSSVAAEQAWAGESVYCATKAATRALTQAMAVELAPFGVRVVAVGPGPIDHDAAGMAATRADPDVRRHGMDRTPWRRYGTPDEVARAVALVADAAWVTGQTLYVDGGFLAAGLAYLGPARGALLERAWPEQARPERA